MNRTLRRPMFRMGGSAEGITSGLQAPRQNYIEAGDVQKIEDQRSLINTLAPRQPRQDRSMSNFLIDFGLDIASRPPSGSIFSTAAAAAKDPFAKFQQAKQMQDAYGMSETSEDRALITELVKGLDEATLSRSRKLADDIIAAKMRGEDGELLTYPQALEKAVSAIVHGVGKEPGELKLEGINTRADILLKQDEDLGYDSALNISKAAQRIFDGDIEGVTKDDIDTDQLFIETEVLNNMELGENGELTLPTDIKETSIGFDIYIEGMVYYNYRDGQFYRKSGKQFIPIQQPES